MKERLSIILIYAMLISLALVGCNNKKETIPEAKAETQLQAQIQSEEKSEENRENIKASIAVKHSAKELHIFSDANCFIDLEVTIHDGDFKSIEDYREFQLIEGQILTVQLDDLAPNFFSNDAIIVDVSCYDPYIYGDTALSKDNYTNIDDTLLIKYSEKEISIYSDTSCLFDLSIFVKNSEFSTFNDFRKIEISQGEILTFSLEDLAPGFFPDDAIIISYNENATISYIEKEN